MFKRDNIYALVAFAVSFLILSFFYYEVLFHPNDYVFASGGDGIKNYYTYLYHAKYDSTFFEFTGMNYPFQENIIFTDAHPLLSYLIGKLGLADSGIGIVNILMLISYPISTVFIYKILKHFKVNILWSICGAIALTFMAPQVFRLTGHFSMSYVFAVPIMWYLLIKTTTSSPIKWNIITSLYLIIFFFTHPYLGLILTVFALAYWFVNWWMKRKIKGSIKQALINIGFQVLLPIVVFQVLVILNDPHVGRLNNPAGFFDLHASLNSLLVAHHGPILNLKPIFGLESGNWESWSYLGLGTMLYGLVIFVYVLKNRKTIAFKEHFKTPLFIFFIASFIVLLFAMCIPFRWSMFKWIVNLFGPLKQFRVLGRFTWIFFYVFTVFVIVLLDKLRDKKINKTPLSIIFFVGIVLFIVEFKPTHESISSEISQSKNPFKIQNIDSDLKDLVDVTKEGKYDAIIFLPFTHLSSESVLILGSEKANYESLLLSYHSNTPLFNTMSSRTSLVEAIHMINLFSPEFIEKSLANVVGPDKKILLVQNSDELDVNEQRMVNSSTQNYKNNTFTAYDFTFDNWNNEAAFQKVMNHSDSAKVQHKDGWVSKDSATWFYYDSFDDTPDYNAMRGEGAFAQKKIGWNKLIELNSDILVDGDYILNFWYNINIGRPDILAVAEKVTSDTTEWVDQYIVRETNLVVEGWAYVELKFSFESTEKINILLTSGPSEDWLVVDELLIRKQGGPDLFNSHSTNRMGKTVYKRDVEFLIYNNYWINTESFQD